MVANKALVEPGEVQLANGRHSFLKVVDGDVLFELAQRKLRVAHVRVGDREEVVQPMRVGGQMHQGGNVHKGKVNWTGNGLI